MSNPNSADQFRKLCEQMNETIRPIVRRSVTPIGAIPKGGQTMQFGTGTFFSLGESSFLVTAGHVWTKAQKYGFELCIFDGDAGRLDESPLTEVSLDGQIHFTKDVADVAVIELDRKTVERLPNRHFLRLQEVSLKAESPGWCWVYGFPQSMTEFHPQSATLRFNELMLGAQFSSEGQYLENYDGTKHFLLDARRDSLERADGSPGTLPDELNGISGGSIWQALWPGQSLELPWDSSKLRIVGVQTSYYADSSLIRATHWGAIAHILYRRKPELRSILEFHLGRAF